MGKNLIFPTLFLLTIFPTGVHDTSYNDYADFQLQTRMHSSRMHTTRSSSCWGGLVLIPLNFPLGCWPGPDPPEFPPWAYTWIWSPSISPLGVGLDLISLNQHALRQTPPPVNRMTDACENITLPQTSFVGGNKGRNRIINVEIWPFKNLVALEKVFSCHLLVRCIRHQYNPIIGLKMMPNYNNGVFSCHRAASPPQVVLTREHKKQGRLWQMCLQNSSLESSRL